MIRTLLATGIIFDFLLALVLHYYGIKLPQGRAGAWPFLVVLFSVLPVPWLLLNRWGLRRFRREWNERGGLPASNLPVNTFLGAARRLKPNIPLVGNDGIPLRCEIGTGGILRECVRK